MRNPHPGAPRDAENYVLNNSDEPEIPAEFEHDNLSLDEIIQEYQQEEEKKQPTLQHPLSADNDNQNPLLNSNKNRRRRSSVEENHQSHLPGIQATSDEPRPAPKGEDTSSGFTIRTSSESFTARNESQ